MPEHEFDIAHVEIATDFQALRLYPDGRDLRVAGPYLAKVRCHGRQEAEAGETRSQDHQ